MRGFGIGLIALVWTGCAASNAATTRAATCHQPASTAPPGWAVWEIQAIQAAQAYVREHGYTSVRVPLETIGKEFADDPEADVELNARIQARARFNKIVPRAVGLRRVYEGGRDWWAVVVPLTDDYLKEHPESSGRAREVYLRSDGSDIYVSEFEVDLSQVERLCSE